MSFLEVFRVELKRVFGDVAVLATIIAGVIIYAFLYPQPYAKENATSIAISVVDLDKSDISREIIFKLNATPQVDVVEQDMNENDAKEAILEGKIKALVIIPSHFKRDLALNVAPTIALGVDTSYFLIYGSVLEATMKTVLTQSVTIKVSNLLKNGEPLSRAKESYSAYSLKSINLFNPQNSYLQYVIPAVFIILLQQTMLIGLGIVGGGVNEREEGDGSIWMVIFSRMAIFMVIYFVHMLFYFGYIFDSLGITHMASIGDLLTFGVPFLLASGFLGISLGALFNSREIATPAILFSSLPLVFTAGFVWPVEAMPDTLRALSMLSPSTVAIDGFLKLNQMGANFSIVLSQYVTLWVEVVVYAILGYYFINKRRRLYVKNNKRNDS
jgi:ABC-2 type transport system permease protein